MPFNILKTKTIPVILAGGLALTAMTGCSIRRPYDTPEFVEIKPNQTAFVIPLEGKTSDQGKFESEELLKKAQVATKRIEVPHKWVQTGRWKNTGEWKDTVRVLVVDRYPETREWSEEKTAFVGESKDSIKFTQGMSATAQILEGDTATFLYQYSGKKLKDVMDSEIRNKIGSVLLEKYSTMTIEEIRADKGSIIDYVRGQVEPYFKERGITLSNIGYIGDLKYVDPAIQTAINKKFNAQEEQKAQEITNKTEIDKAKAEAQANKTRKESMKEIVEMKQIELQLEWIKKWNGVLPQVSSDGEGMIINVPKAEESK
jgi:SPFH domain / Band 7 family